MKWTTDSLVEHLKNPATKCLVKFTADWCGPCRRIHGQLQQLYEASELTEMIVIDIDEEQEIAQQMGVASIPQMIIAFNGRRKEIIGADMEQVERAIADLQQLTPLLGDQSDINAVVHNCATVHLD